MNQETGVVALLILAVGLLLGYIVKRNFDENTSYITAGYHYQSSSGWVK